MHERKNELYGKILGICLRVEDRYFSSIARTWKSNSCMNKNELFKEYLEICLKVESQQFASMVSTWGGVGTAGWSFSPEEHECKKLPKMPNS